MRAVQILIAAVILGLVGGYGWSTMAPRTRHVQIPKAVYAVPPDAPQSLSDKEWAARAFEKSPPALAPASPDPSQVEQSAYYSNCDQARAAGRAPIRAGEPGYRSALDGDDDGIACEPHRLR